MILTDLAEVFYAPQQAFKKIVANPKYLGAIIVFVLFIALSVGFEYSQFGNTNTEQTYPTIDQLYTLNNATYTVNSQPVWRSSNNVVITNNFEDFYNYSIYVAGFGLAPSDSNAYYRAFGNNSLQMAANNTNSITAAISNAFNVDCTVGNFQNLTLFLKQVGPSVTPQNATLTLYSLGDTNFYTYDLTGKLSSTANIGQWNNITVPLGPHYESSWISTGNPTWQNITSLTLTLNYGSSQNVILRVGGVFFHGEYLTPVQYNATGILLQFLQLFSLQFLFSWFILTGLIYFICRGLKSTITWKPIFVALGFAMIVMVIRMAINLLATFAMPTIYYSFDLSLGVRFDPTVAVYYPPDAAVTLSAQSQALLATINSQTELFHGIITVMGAISYVWLGGLAALGLKSAKPEFSTVKCLAIAAVGLVITVLLLLFLVGSF